jgi:hypothetical protein
MFFGYLGKLAALLAIPAALFLASCSMFQSKSTAAGIGQEVFDGQFAFVVNQVEASPTFNNTKAQGVYQVVSMAVRNVSKEAQFFEWNAQKLKDNADRKYSAIFMDPPRIGDVGDSIDPGLQVSIKLAFDVTPGSKPTQIVLHDSLSSPGVPVDLSSHAAH